MDLIMSTKKTLHATIGSGCEPVTLSYSMDSEHDHASVELWGVYTLEGFDLFGYIEEAQLIELEMEIIAHEREILEDLDYQARLDNRYL